MKLIIIFLLYYKIVKSQNPTNILSTNSNNPLLYVDDNGENIDQANTNSSISLFYDDYSMKNIDYQPTSNQETSSTLHENENNSEKRMIGNSDCTKDEIENKQALVTINGMLKNGEDLINQNNNKTENTILVLGNAGSGKTTFVQFIGGNNSLLIARETGNDTGNFVIDDGIKIGISNINSLTLYPEQVIVDSKTSLTDTPGFSDTRSENHEIVATYTMKKYLKNIKNIKIVLLITYYSVKQGVYKDDFMDLLQNINSFIKDIEKYKDSIVLIATKVPNKYKIIKNNVTLISNEKIINNIAEYIIQVKHEIKENLQNTIKDKTFLENAIKIADYLTETDIYGRYTKINIFRQPTEEGRLSTMTALQEEKKSLKKTVYNVTSYTKLSYNDIGYTLSYRAKNYLYCLLWYINENITRMSSDIFQQIENYYLEKIKNIDDISLIKPEIELLIKKLKLLKNELKESKTTNNYLTIIDNYINNNKIQINNIYENDTVLEFNKYIRDLENFADTQLILSTLEWAEQMKTILNNLEEHLSWYDFLINLFEYFSSYEFQKSKPTLNNTIDYSNQTQKDTIKTLLLNLNTTIIKDTNVFLNYFIQNEDRKIEINEMLTLALNKPSNITCDNKGKLTVTGYFVKLSEINNFKIIKKYCKNEKLKAIGIYAIHTIFIDGDLNDEYFREVDMMIAAPKWEIIGQRIINIDGKSGQNYKSKADDGIYAGENGKDGKPGLPGGNGGNFIGIGLLFANEGNLVVTANGGNGGSGQVGGNGQKGSKGRDGQEKFYHNLPNSLNFNESWSSGSEIFPHKSSIRIDMKMKPEMRIGYCRSDIKIYNQDGDCGEIGGFGGNGGVGGIGGEAGKILLIGKDESPKFVKQNTKGGTGHPGKGGNGGETGENGHSIACFQTSISQIYHRGGDNYYCSNYDSATKSFWNCIELNSVVCPKQSTEILTGISGHVNEGILQPNIPQDYDFSENLDKYLSSLKTNENNKYIMNYATKFLSEIYKNEFIMKEQSQSINLTAITTPNIILDDTIDDPDTFFMYDSTEIK